MYHALLYIIYGNGGGVGGFHIFVVHNLVQRYTHRVIVATVKYIKKIILILYTNFRVRQRPQTKYVKRRLRILGKGVQMCCAYFF